MTVDSAVPHVIASGETVFLRSGDLIQIRSGNRVQRAVVVSPAAKRKGEAVVTVAVKYKTRGPAKRPKAVAPDHIVATGWPV